jgi:hypothetical protein
VPQERSGRYTAFVILVTIGVDIVVGILIGIIIAAASLARCLESRCHEIRPDAALRGERERVTAGAEAILDQHGAKARGARAENIRVQGVAHAEHPLGLDAGEASQRLAIDPALGLAAEDQPLFGLVGDPVRVVAGLGVPRARLGAALSRLTGR